MNCKYIKFWHTFYTRMSCSMQANLNFYHVDKLNVVNRGKQTKLKTKDCNRFVA